MSPSDPADNEHKSPRNHRLFVEIARMALIAVGYFIAVRIGLLFIAQPEGIASIWPPSGIALSALLVNERRKWLRILLIIFVVNTAGNMAGGNTLLVSLGFALANTLEPALAAGVIAYFCGLRPTFARTSEVLVLCGGALFCNGLTALVGASVPAIAFGSNFFRTWLVWIVADGLGIILITPVIITWVIQPPLFRRISPARLAEGAALLIAVGLVPWIINNFLTPADHAFFKIYLVFPLLIWAALRFSPRTVAAALLLFTMIVLWHTIQGSNIFGLTGLRMKENLLSAQVLLTVTTLSGLILAAIVSERKQMQTSLQESKDRFHSIIKNTEAGYFFIDREGRFQDVNEAWLRMHCYASKAEVIGRHYSLSQTEADIRAADSLVEKLLTGKSIPKGEFSRRCKDGSVGYHSFTVGPVYSGSKLIGFEGFVIDTTEQKTLEAQLRQAQKMQAIGTLAGGIAHDFNNILSIILGNAELALEDVPAQNPARFNLDEIIAAGLRAREIVKQLLHFTRMTDPQPKPLQIHSVILDTLKIVRASLPATVEIRTDITNESMMVLGDPGQLNQMLINLCNNANQAMPKGGTLEIGATEVVLDEKTISRYGDLSPGRYVHLTIKDTGHGIRAEHLDRIYDPYFTTRDVGEGSGMGLAIVHAVVMKNKGAISVESEVGNGTTFHILLPVAVGETLPNTQEKEKTKYPTGREHVLLVDDEEAIVKMVCQRLERLGYTVQTATSPIRALELFRSGPNEFDLVISDLTMPQMTGEELVQAILSIRPEIPIILCSGFSDRVSKEKAKEIGAADYLEKPHDMHVFAQTVRSVLNGRKQKKPA